MHRVAMVIYGQPREVKDGIIWKNAYWNRVKEQRPDVVVDWYYHLWDGVSVNASTCADIDELEYYSSISNTGFWLNRLKRLSKMNIRQEIIQIHSELGINTPTFHDDMEYEFIDHFYNSQLVPKFKEIITSIESSDQTAQSLATRSFMNFCNTKLSTDFAAPISASLAHSLVDTDKYDTVFLTRTDTIFEPGKSEHTFVNAINNEFGWVMNGVHQIDICQSMINDINDVWFNDYAYIGSPTGFKIMFSDWKQKIKTMMIQNFFREYIADKFNLSAEISFSYNIHTVFGSMIKSDIPYTVQMSTGYLTALNNQVLLRTGHLAERGDTSNVAFNLIRDRFYDSLRYARVSLTKDSVDSTKV